MCFELAFSRERLAVYADRNKRNANLVLARHTCALSNNFGVSRGTFTIYSWQLAWCLVLAQDIAARRSGRSYR